MIYVIRGKSNNKDFYAIKSGSSGKTVYYLSGKLKDATKWKTESNARKVLNQGLATGGAVFQDIKVVSLSEDEYEAIIQRESEAKTLNTFEQQRDYIFSDKVQSSYTDNDRQIATMLLNLKVGDRIRLYPKRNTLAYTIVEVVEIKSTTFVVEGKEYSRLTGEGEQAEYAVPDDAVSDRIMSDRIIESFCFNPSAYNLTAEQKLAIAKILRG